jgi:Type III restriction enzyme, res subunit
MEQYNNFLNAKRHSVQNFGIEPTFMPDKLFDYQKFIADHLIRKGRGAGYLDTGTGKTIIELVTAYNYHLNTGKPVLILTPLAVAFQFLKEAEKFGIDDISYSKDGRFDSRIVVANYERLHYFSPADFDCVICDESSCLKNDEGATRSEVTAFLKKVKYRFLFTATPSPNDFTELGTSSEALGYLGYTDMLTKFFKNNEDTISPQNIGNEWRLKGHAEKAFFEWVSSWSISMRKPSDLGFDDARFVLPKLIVNYNWVKNTKPPVINGQYQMFNIVARTNKEILAERRATVNERCEKSVEIASGHETSVYWVNLNDEGDIIAQIDKSATQLKGGMDLDQKEEILLAFLNGEIKKLITKPKITAFGLNWQHCGHSTVFPTFSFEQWYQLIRRFWRFGRVGDVVIDAVLSDGQKRILDAILAKAEKSDSLFSQLNANINRDFRVATTEFDKKIILPSFL